MPISKHTLIRNAFPKGEMPYRRWLSREWSNNGATALVIGINPNDATDTKEDGMTRFLVELLSNLKGELACGKYILVNCFDLRERDPKKLKTVKSPVSPTNFGTIKRMLAKCDFVVASWGTTNYGPVVNNARNKISALILKSEKQIICFSPKGQPIYCSRTNMNSSDGRWSKRPVEWSGPIPSLKRLGV